MLGSRVRAPGGVPKKTSRDYSRGFSFLSRFRLLTPASDSGYSVSSDYRPRPGKPLARLQGRWSAGAQGHNVAETQARWSVEPLGCWGTGAQGRKTGHHPAILLSDQHLPISILQRPDIPLSALNLSDLKHAALRPFNGSGDQKGGPATVPGRLLFHTGLTLPQLAAPVAHGSRAPHHLG